MEASLLTAALVSMLLLTGGCIGTPIEEKEEDDQDPPEEAPGTMQPSSSAEDDPGVLPYNETLTVDELEGDLAYRVTLRPAEEAVCGWSYETEGVNQGSPLAARAWDSADEASWLIAFDHERAHVEGELSTPPIGQGTWAIADTVTTHVDGSVSLYLSTFGIRSLTLTIGCQEAFTSSIHAGSEELIPLASGDWDGGTAASAPPIVGVDASHAKRSWTLTSNLSVLELVSWGEKTLEEGELRLSTPSTVIERSYDGDRMDRVFLEDGPGDYAVDVSRASIGENELRGFIAGMEPVGDSLADLGTWLRS